LLFVDSRSRVCYRLGLACEVGNRWASNNGWKGQKLGPTQTKRGPSFNLAENLY
jgi:hypothetical protein